MHLNNRKTCSEMVEERVARGPGKRSCRMFGFICAALGSLEVYLVGGGDIFVIIIVT